MFGFRRRCKSKFGAVSSNSPSVCVSAEPCACLVVGFGCVSNFAGNSNFIGCSVVESSFCATRNSVRIGDNYVVFNSAGICHVSYIVTGTKNQAVGNMSWVAAIFLSSNSKRQITCVEAVCVGVAVCSTANPRNHTVSADKAGSKEVTGNVALVKATGEVNSRNGAGAGIIGRTNEAAGAVAVLSPVIIFKLGNVTVVCTVGKAYVVISIVNCISRAKEAAGRNTVNVSIVCTAYELFVVSSAK